MWQHSGLGRRIVNNEMDDLESLNLSSKQVKTLKEVLQNNKH